MSEQSTKKALRIAILGWGSLVWDGRPEFDIHHEEWQPDGPMLPLEFTRVSKSRQRALTLVIDPQNGAQCRSAYAISTRRDPADAIADLRGREGTIIKRIGFYFADGSRTCELEVPEAIAPWAAAKRLDVVVWTGLKSNFKQETKRNFSIEAAIDHLHNLTPEGKAMAATYVWRARFGADALAGCLADRTLVLVA